MTRALPLVMALSVTQVIGWATAFNALALLARAIAQDLGLSLPTALAGSSVFLVALALTSRALAPLYQRNGAGPVLVAGSLAATIGFVALAFASGPITYAAAWLILGASGAAMLTAPAHSLLVQAMGRDAKRSIAAVMLVSGLGGAIGLPLTSALLELTDWRGTYLAFAALHVLICAPLHLWACRRTGPPAPQPETARQPPTATDTSRFRLMALSVSLIGFVTWGFAIVIVELLRATGLTPAQSVTAASLIGAATVAARAAETAFAPTLPATTTAIWATAALCLSLLLLALGGTPGAWTFVILFGAASGIMSVARATLPLELFAPAAYAGMAARLALPMNLAFAAAPLAFGLILDRAGAQSVLGLAVASSLAALAALIALRQTTQHTKGR